MLRQITMGRTAIPALCPHHHVCGRQVQAAMRARQHVYRTGCLGLRVWAGGSLWWLGFATPPPRNEQGDQQPDQEFHADRSSSTSSTNRDPTYASSKSTEPV
jgi:hypothetical protein